jgi:hypothetical protein
MHQSNFALYKSQLKAFHDALGPDMRAKLDHFMVGVLCEHRVCL